MTDQQPPTDPASDEPSAEDLDQPMPDRMAGGAASGARSAGDDAAETVRSLRARAAALRGEPVTGESGPAGTSGADASTVAADARGGDRTGGRDQTGSGEQAGGGDRSGTGDHAPGGEQAGGDDASVVAAASAEARVASEADDEPRDGAGLDEDVNHDAAEAALSGMRSRGVNRASVVAALVTVAVGAGSFFGARALFATDGDGPANRFAEDADSAGPTATTPVELEDLTSEITLPPGPEDGLAVVETGITIVEDRFDPERREGTYALVIENPNDDQLAQAVQVDVDFLDVDGDVVGTDTAFVEVVLPSQRVAVASLLFDAPTEAVVDLEVTLDVARWRDVSEVGGRFVVRDVETVEADFAGVETTCTLVSTFDEDLRDVVVTAVYRRGDGSIIGGADTFVELLESGTPTEATMALLANVAVEEVASTEVYPAAAFGFVPGDPIG